jgi:LAGLIDADG endonuclease
VLGTVEFVMNDAVSDNASGAGNQQERLSIDAIPTAIGNFLAGFALGEGSFMIVCRPRVDYRRGWKISAAFNVSQQDATPLELFREQLGCGSIRKAGNDGWYLEVNTLADIPVGGDPVLSQIPTGREKGRRLRVVRSGGGDPGQAGAERCRLSRGAAPAGAAQPRRQATVHDGENPQRLYAELFRNPEGMR